MRNANVIVVIKIEWRMLSSLRTLPTFGSSIVASLRRISCHQTATITQNALDNQRKEDFIQCDRDFFEAAEPIAEKLLDFISSNRTMIKFTEA
jgi:hypothetical protein